MFNNFFEKDEKEIEMSIDNKMGMDRCIKIKRGASSHLIHSQKKLLVKLYKDSANKDTPSMNIF